MKFVPIELILIFFRVYRMRKTCGEIIRDGRIVKQEAIHVIIVRARFLFPISHTLIALTFDRIGWYSDCTVDEQHYRSRIGRDERTRSARTHAWKHALDV